jgi:small subunit ribosomal protein S11
MAEESEKTEVLKADEAVVATEGAAEAPEETVKKRKKSKRQVFKGRASIQCTYNNTIVSLADANGAVLGWSSSGHLGFKGAKKSTPYAATQVVGDVTEKVKKYGLQEVEVFVKGVGSGREAAIRALANNGFSLVSIKDLTPIPHNGCRPRRPRRI